MPDFDKEIPIRVLIAKLGLDGHDRGAKVIAAGLRDEGMEVIYTGLRKSPDLVVNTVIQEDVDAVGISILSGAHMTLLPRFKEQLHLKGVDDVMLLAGGIIPDTDRQYLLNTGYDAVFTPGTPIKDIAGSIRRWVQNSKQQETEDKA